MFTHTHPVLDTVQGCSGLEDESLVLRRGTWTGRLKSGSEGPEGCAQEFDFVL